MSSLAYTAQFIRVGSSPFGSKRKDVTVFAQLLVGGSGIWIFSPASADGQRRRLRVDEAEDIDVLKAGFALTDQSLDLVEVSEIAERVGRSAHADIDLSGADVQELSAAVGHLAVDLHLTMFESQPEMRIPATGNWRVTTAVVPPTP